MPPLRETAEFRRGRTGEQIVTGLLRAHGYYVVPSYDYSGEDGNKAPKLQGDGEAWPIPDLDVAKASRRHWVEVKTKRAPSFTYVTRRLEHGIPQRHFEAYQRVEEITGTPVWLAIVEEESGEVLIARLADIAAHARFYRGGRMDRGGMVFFPRDQFRLLDRVQPAELQ